MSLDLEVAQRQTFATSFRQEDVDRLLDGRLLMPPHPEWALPERPTWQEDPFEDRNWRFQFHMLRWLDPLRRAAAQGDDAAFEMWLRWTKDWVARNPPEAPVTSWAWTDMSDGIRAQQLCSASTLIAERAPDELEWLESTIRIHADHLADPANMGNANHALHQQESLFVCGRVLGDEELWQLAGRRMASLLREQYDAQGMNAEGATAYHVNNFLWWERALRRFDVEGLPRPDGSDRHLGSPVAIAHSTRPDGTLVPIGDTDTVVPDAVRSPFIQYVTSNGAAGRAPQRTTEVFDAGYVFSRSGWGDEYRPFSDHTFYSLRFGPAERVHGHPDGTSLTYSSRGVHWVTDLGKHQYGKSVPRDHVVSRAAHSLVSIEGATPFRLASVQLVKRRVTPRLQEFVLEDESFLLYGISLTRRVVHSVAGEYLVVVDEVDAPRPIRATQRWQLGPEVFAEVDHSASRAQLTAEGSSARGVIAFLSGTEVLTSVRGQEDPFDGWVSIGWKNHVPATALHASASGEQLRFLTVIAAGDDEARVEELPWPRPGEKRFEVSTGQLTERVLVTADSVTINPKP